MEFGCVMQLWKDLENNRLSKTSQTLKNTVPFYLYVTFIGIGKESWLSEMGELFIKNEILIWGYEKFRTWITVMVL